MLVGVVGLFESQERFEMFRENEFEIMYFNRRVAYFQSYQDPKPSLNPPFSSVYARCFFHTQNTADPAEQSRVTTTRGLARQKGKWCRKEPKL